MAFLFAEIVIRRTVAGVELPKDAIEDGTAINGRAAADGWRGRGKDWLNQAPLFASEVKRII